MTLKGVLTSLVFIWNLLVFATYGWDKYCAKRGYWRISERFLLLESLFLGAIGAISGAHLFNHKTRKWYFHGIWWLGMVLLLGTLYMIWFGGVL